MFAHEKDYVNKETALLLKNIGFIELCDSMFSTSVVLKETGEPIGSDEEYELRSAGRAKEIKRIKFGAVYHIACVNKPNNKNTLARPTLFEAQMYLLEVHWRHIEIVTRGQTFWGFRVCYPAGCAYESKVTYKSYREALSAGIQKAAKMLWDVMKLNSGA